MDIASIRQLINEGKIEYVKIGAPDIDGVWRGKRVASRFFLESLEDGFAQCDVIFGWDIAENVLPEVQQLAARLR
jgi:glutamine synthetase